MHEPRPCQRLVRMVEGFVSGRFKTGVQRNATAWLVKLLRAAEGVIINREGTLQPRDRRPVRVHLDVSEVAPAAGVGIQLRWDLEREEPPTG